MASGISQTEPGVFRVDFASLMDGGFVRRLLRKGPVTVTVQAVGQAVLAALGESSQRGMDGQLIAWNQFRICLSRADYDQIHPLRDRLVAELEMALVRTLEELQAETIGDPLVRVLVDDEVDLPRGFGVIYATYRRDEELAPVSDGEVTVRVRQKAPRGAPGEPRRWGQPKSVHSAEPERVGEPTAGDLRVTWPGGGAVIPAGHKVQLGRPHGDPPEGFVAIEGASNRINSMQLAIDNSAGGVVITRPVSANPVTVAGRLVQPGGKLAVANLPVDIDLSSGDLLLCLEDAG